MAWLVGDFTSADIRVELTEEHPFVLNRNHQVPGRTLKRVDCRQCLVVGFLLIWQLVLLESGDSRPTDCQNHRKHVTSRQGLRARVHMQALAW